MAMASGAGRVCPGVMEVKMDRLIAAVKMLMMCVCVSAGIVVYMLK